MNNYAESKMIIDNIRNKYSEVLFRYAISHLMDVGIRHLDKDLVEDTCKQIMQEDDANHIMTNEFKCNILRAAYELAQVPHIDLLVYIQREVVYDVLDNELSYGRAIQLIKGCMNCIESDYCEQTLNDFQWLGFSDDEIEALGWGYILDSEEED